MRTLDRTVIIPLLLLPILGGITTSVADTRLYRWEDSDGTVIHSDRPPTENVDYQIVSAPAAPRPSQDTETSEKTTVDEDGLDPLDPREVANTQKDPERCQTAKVNLDTLSNSEEVKILSEEGEERLMAPEEILVERQTAKAQISVYCEE